MKTKGYGNFQTPILYGHRQLFELLSAYLVNCLLTVRLQRKEHIFHSSTTQSLIFKILARSLMRQSKYMLRHLGTKHVLFFPAWLFSRAVRAFIFWQSFAWMHLYLHNFSYITIRVKTFEHLQLVFVFNLCNSTYLLKWQPVSCTYFDTTNRFYYQMT